MDNTLAVVLVAVVFLVFLLFVSLKSLQTKEDVEIESEIAPTKIKGKIKGISKHTTSGSATVSKVEAEKNIAVGQVVGAKGDQATDGEAKVKNIKAKGNIDIGNVIGVDKEQ